MCRGVIGMRSADVGVRVREERRVREGSVSEGEREEGDGDGGGRSVVEEEERRRVEEGGGMEGVRMCVECQGMRRGWS